MPVGFFGTFDSRDLVDDIGTLLIGIWSLPLKSLARDLKLSLALVCVIKFGFHDSGALSKLDKKHAGLRCGAPHV